MDYLKRSKELFDESYCGYIDSNTLRAGYPESKRCSEALCQAFNKQENIDSYQALFDKFISMDPYNNVLFFQILKYD